MITIKKLSSSTGLIDSVDFTNGINIIMGKYSNVREKGDLNGIGKSSLIRLIDFCLLSNSAKNIFSLPKYNFLRQENHTISLEINVDQTPYYITRSFNSLDEVYFGSDMSKLYNYSVIELKNILMGLFFKIEKDIKIKGNNFRSLMHFFIKDDLEQHKRFKPLNFVGSNVPTKKVYYFNLFLLGLPNLNYEEFIEKDEILSGIRVEKRSNEEKIQEQTGMTYGQFQTEKLNIQSKINNLRDSLSNYIFLENYKDVENELIKITEEINKNLTVLHRLNMKLEKIQNSLEIKIEIDVERIKEIYDRINESLGEYVNKTLNDVIDFRKKIAINRERHLSNEVSELKNNISDIINKISSFEQNRSKLFKILEEKGALDSLKNSYEELINEKVKLQKPATYLEDIEKNEKEILELKTELNNLNKSIYDDFKEFEEVIENLRTLFIELLTNSITVEDKSGNAYFNIKIISNLKNPIKIDIEIPASEAQGKSRLLLILYDLMVFLNIINSGRKLPSFLIHDGVFASISRATIVRTLNYLYKKSLEHPNFQYITTFNYDDIPSETTLLKEEFIFDINKKIIKEYRDDPEHMIFKRKFE